MENSCLLTKYQNIFIYMLIFYTFIYSNVIKLILSNELNINLMYSFLPIFLITGYYLISNKIRLYVMLVSTTLFLLVFINHLSNQIEMERFIKFFVIIIVPLLLIGIKLVNEKKTIKKIISIFNWIVILNIIY